jgi:hypothetical protein
MGYGRAQYRLTPPINCVPALYVVTSLCLLLYSR